ncbi:MAG: cupin domain-containing protein [Candidatus Thiodiazotropha endolucinida]
MKTTTLIITLCTMYLATSATVFAESEQTSGMMLTLEDLKWKDNPRVTGLGVAHIIGHGKKPGPFVYRVRFPKGRIVQPHSHPDDRTYTVISGTWHIGWGEKYDPDKMTALPAGSFYTEPAGVPHFIATPDSETVVQITGTGPTAAQFVDPSHAPKK